MDYLIAFTLKKVQKIILGREKSGWGKLEPQGGNGGRQVGWNIDHQKLVT